MGAVDPTYPLYPIACIIAAALLFLVLLSSFVRQSWNLGVAFLCFWLLLETLTGGIDAIIWSDNADIKMYVYCDIVSHLQLVAFVVKPMSTLLITRRLYLIASLRSVDLPSDKARRLDQLQEWTLGFIVPVLVAGPIYYVVQSQRFQVQQGLGCQNTTDTSILAFLLIYPWLIMPPLLSAILYYPRVARILYHQGKEFNRFLQSNNSISRTTYMRVLVIASVDLIISLSLSIPKFAFTIVSYNDSASIIGSRIPFYSGWNIIHNDWEPTGVEWAWLSPFQRAVLLFSNWTTTVFSVIIFALFGLSEGARASYWGAFCTFTGWFGWNPSWRGRDGRTYSPLNSIRLSRRNIPQQNTISLASFELAVPGIIDNVSSSPDVSVEGQGKMQAAMRQETESEGHARRFSDETECVKREQTELSTVIIDISEVMFNSAARMTV